MKMSLDKFDSFCTSSKIRNISGKSPVKFEEEEEKEEEEEEEY